MITVNINGKTITVQGHAPTDGLTSMRIIFEAIASASPDYNNHHIDHDTGMVTLHAADMDYPMCAVDIVHLVQYINHQNCKAFDPMPAPPVYMQYLPYADKPWG